jgi:glucuronate isomerase
MWRDDRYFGPDPHQEEAAQRLYETVRHLPLICSLGHVDPAMFADPNYSFGTPVDLPLIPDHYIFRMLYSQGIPLEDLGVPRQDCGPVNQDHRQIWQIFAEHFYLFRATPTSLWLNHAFYDVFGIREKLNGETAQVICDRLVARLSASEMRPHWLFEHFNIEVLAPPTPPPTHLKRTKRSVRPAGRRTSARRSGPMS